MNATVPDVFAPAQLGGAAVCAQIGHAGPVPNAASNRLPALAPTRRLSLLCFRMTRAATEWTTVFAAACCRKPGTT